MEAHTRPTDKKHEVHGKGIHRKLSATTEMGKPKGEPSPISLRERKSKRERWLLTRKTWRYMADAGRRLIPEGVHNRQEDVPKIEAYFQEVCQKEPKFLLWRKSSYPGALGLRSHNRRARTRKKGGSYREKASSADEAEEIKKSCGHPCGGGLYLTTMKTGIGRFDLKKLSEEAKEEKRSQSEEELFKQLESLLVHGEDTPKTLNHQELFDKLEKYLRDIQRESMLKHRCDVMPDLAQREMLETLRRHYRKSPNRQAVISNLLTERKLLEKLYFDLRRTRGFRGPGTTYFPDWKSNLRPRGEDLASPEEATESESEMFHKFPTETRQNPPAIEVEEITRITKSIQTLKIHQDMLKAIEDRLKSDQQAQQGQQIQLPVPQQQPQASKQQQKDTKTGRRKSSVDHDDVSPSVGDTIKRYLKMARKKSVDTDKADRFKMINYDKNLRNIKPKGEQSMPGDDDGLHKGCQTDDSWINALKGLHIEESWVVTDGVKEVVTVSESKAPSLRSSCESLVAPQHHKPGLLASGQTFLSNLLHGLQHSDKTSVSPTAMQKSKSSTSVGRTLVSKKIWRGRSKSQSRIPTAHQCSWTPQGNCVWSNVAGRHVTLTDTNILHLTDIERKILQKVALAKLQALNIGCHIQLPSEIVGSSTQEAKPKRRPHLLKRKAITTSFFDTSRGKDKEGAGSGLVFGIPLSQCVENEKVGRTTNSSFKSKDSTFPDDTDLELRRKSHHGSRTSFSSLTDARTHEESAGSTESLGSSAPGLLDSLSVGSTADITEPEPNIPNIVSACLRHIENFGLHTLGIFRVSSSKKRVRQLREEFDSGKEMVLGEDYCPHDVATLLKEYFRDLPEPLLCKDLYQAFVHTQKIRNRRLQFEALQHLIQLLPVPNRDTLWSLLNFLSLVAANCNDHNNDLGEFIPGNKMDSNNLATLFAPNILHPSLPALSKEALSAQSCEERIDVINVIRSMIDRNKELFQVSSELLDEVYVHMMDTHPEALDQLLRKRELGEEVLDDPDSGVLEELGTGSESSSLPQSPKALVEPSEVASEEKRFYSREQFLHESVDYENSEYYEKSHRYREKERGRTGSGKKRWKENEGEGSQHPDNKLSGDEDHKSRNIIVDSSAQSKIEFAATPVIELAAKASAGEGMPKVYRPRLKPVPFAPVQTLRSSFQIAPGLGPPITVKSSKLSILIEGTHTPKPDLVLPKEFVTLKQPLMQSYNYRCQDIKVGNEAIETVEIVDRPTVPQDQLLRPGDPSPDQTGLGRVCGVIKASLRIPTGSFALNLDDSDIPFIEDSGGIFAESSKHQMSMGVVRHRSSVNYTSTRHHSSDSSSQVSTPVGLQPVSGSVSLIQGGYDSAIGSSATYSSPPRNAATSSISSGSDREYFSSPPSWASSPPLSPDSQTSVDYLPEENSLSTIGRISIASKGLAEQEEKHAEEEISTVRVTSKTQKKSEKTVKTKETHRKTSGEYEKTKSVTKEFYHKVHSFVGGSLASDAIPKSASSSQLVKKSDPEPEASDWSRRVTTSISNIGGAVMRSKTADIERMLKIKPDSKGAKGTKTEAPKASKTESDPKKNTKRRYTDSRHPTKTIPDVRERASAASVQMKTQSVWKRREIIASPPKDSEDS